MIHVDVAGDVQVAEAFERSDSWVRQRFKAVVVQLADALRREVQDRKLSGPVGPKRRPGDPLGVGSVLASRTGKLRNSVVTKSYEFNKTIAARVFPTASNRGDRYGFMLGAGAHKTADVGRYTRSAPNRDRFRSAHVSASGKVRAIKSSSGVEFVKAARRRINLNRRPFTSSVLAERRDSIMAAMQQAVEQTAQELQAQINGVSGGEGI